MLVWMNADTAMDVAQRRFTGKGAMGRWGSYTQSAGLADARGAGNLAEDYAKSGFRRNRTNPPQTMNGVQGREPLPLDHLETEETFGKLRELLAEMPKADREILTLRYALDYDTEKIAEALDVNASAVHMRLTRAYQRLADRLHSNGIHHASLTETIARRIMSNLSPLPTDDVDGVLRAFFKAQMPAPWPALRAPSEAAKKTVQGWPLMRSRLALAASVGLLALGLSSLAGAFHGHTIPTEQGIRIENPSTPLRTIRCTIQFSRL